MKVTDLREAHGMSQAQLAAKAKLHPSTVSAIESGRLEPYPIQARKLARALHWQGDIDDLFKEDNNG